MTDSAEKAAAPPASTAPERAERPATRQRTLVRDPVHLRQAQLRRMNRKIRLKGEVLLPCLPALLDEFVSRLRQVFSALGKPFSANEIAQLRKLMAQELDKGFAKSALSQLKVSWWSDESKDLLVHYRVQVVQRTKSGQYEYWVKSRKPPLFGAHPDACVIDLAARFEKGARIADLGAGTGRNALALAAAGYRVDAVDATASFVETIRSEAAARGLSDRVDASCGDILTDRETLPETVYSLVLLAQVLPDLRQLSDARKIFWRANYLLKPGGFLLFNAFLADPGYEPDRITRELAQFQWSSLLTRAELDEARRGMPFDLVIDENAHDYERARLSEWPPTGWYSHWAQGNDLFGLTEDQLPPVSLRWLAYRKRG